MTVIDAAGPAALLAGCTKEYEAPDRQVVVGPLDLRVDRGDYVAITGPSGSGKTTFLSILGALDRPSRGRATIGGIESSEAPARVLARLRESFIGFVFQQYHLFARRTALENVLMAFGPPPLHPGEERVAACVLALERVGLGHRTQAPAGALSGGEQQRVAIARALVKRPGLLLCDEPTGNLDAGASATVMGLVEEALEHAAVVIVTHDDAVARRARERVVLPDPRELPRSR